MKIRILVLAAFMASVVMPVSAMQMYKCSLTHNVEDQNQQQKVEIISNDSIVFDNGNSFTFSPDGKQKITSPELHKIKTPNGDTVLAATQSDLTFVKLKDSYVLRNSGEGYVFADCTKISK